MQPAVHPLRSGEDWYLPADLERTLLRLVPLVDAGDVEPDVVDYGPMSLKPARKADLPVCSPSEHFQAELIIIFRLVVSKHSGRTRGTSHAPSRIVSGLTSGFSAVFSLQRPHVYEIAT